MADIIIIVLNDHDNNELLQNTSIPTDPLFLLRNPNLKTNREEIYLDNQGSLESPLDQVITVKINII